MEVRLTDAPAKNGLSLLITIQEVQVKGDGDWQTVVKGESRVDLTALVGVETVLGTASLPAGRYQQVRFRVSDPVIAHEGSEMKAGLGTERPVLTLDALVEAARTTVVVIDIDAAESFQFTGDQPVFETKAKATARPG